MSEETYTIFKHKEDALDTIASSLQLCKRLAERHGIPFLAVFQLDGYVMSTWKHFPEEETVSELKAAWCEIAGPEDDEKEV